MKSLMSFGLAIVLASLGTVSAQQSSAAPTPRLIASSPGDPTTYGTTSSIVLNLSPEDFVAYGFDDVRYFRSLVTAPPFAAADAVAPLDLPNGAVVDSFEYFYYDSHTSLNPNADFASFNALGQTTEIAPVNFFPIVSNGENSLFVTLQTPITINNLTNHYSLRFFLISSASGDIGLRRVRVRYRLQVSPAPATAAFADVPVGDPFHRFVEALVAAGITGGCGGGNYCPNAPVTRGQMAVFLAAALGLHWPN